MPEIATLPGTQQCRDLHVCAVGTQVLSLLSHFDSPVVFPFCLHDV